MRKHMFLMGWRKEGRTLKREFHAYTSCIWPLHPDANEKNDATALLAMVDGIENLPKEVQEFCNAYHPMMLRSRYAGHDVTGPYLIDDVDEAFDMDTLEAYLDTLSDQELGKYHCKAIVEYDTKRRHRR
jgi:hypothetical protein